MKNLVSVLLNRDPSKRPRVHDILNMPLIKNRIKDFLTKTQVNLEFNHTVIHSKNLNQIFVEDKQFKEKLEKEKLRQEEIEKQQKNNIKPNVLNRPTSRQDNIKQEYNINNNIKNNDIINDLDKNKEKLNEMDIKYEQLRKERELKRKELDEKYKFKDIINNENKNEIKDDQISNDSRPESRIDNSKIVSNRTSLSTDDN